MFREEALEELKGYQKQDFEGIFEAMDGLPVTIRLLDPPLHEFLPKEGSPLEMLCEQLAQELHITSQDVKVRVGCFVGFCNPACCSRRTVSATWRCCYRCWDFRSGSTARLG